MVENVEAERYKLHHRPEGFHTNTYPGTNTEERVALLVVTLELEDPSTSNYIAFRSGSGGVKYITK